MRLAELARLFATYGLKDAFLEQEALFCWAEVVGPQTARLTNPQIVRDGVLYVQVGNHVFAQEYTLMRQAWLGRLNQRLQRPLRDIRFKVVALEAPRPKSPSPTVEDVALDEPQRQEIARLVSEVEGGPLREALRGLFETYAKIQRIKAGQPNQRACPGCGLYHDGEGPLCAFCQIEGKTTD